MTRVLIMAGGTGGHIYPALAVADELSALGAQVIWLGTRKGLEATIVPGRGIDIEWISVGGLRGKTMLHWVLAPLRLMIALMQSLAVLLRRRPMVVLGMGGFVTGPGGLATSLLRKPLVIHEQNAIPGTTNRILARLATRVLEAFPNTFPGRVHAMNCGNPVRRDICRLPSPEQRFKNRGGPLRLLVLGGSQGAEALNQAVPLALQKFSTAGRPLVWHQAGARHFESAQHRYSQAGIAAMRLEPYIEDMAEAYSWADIVLCRAGALTIAELAAAGLGSILVPYPFAVDDHQTKNAALLVDAGAAVLLPQDELNGEILADLLGGFIDQNEAPQANQGQTLAIERSRLLMMADKARALASPDAAQTVAQVCLRLGRET